MRRKRIQNPDHISIHMTSLFGILIMAVFGGFFHFLHAKKTLKTLQFQFFEKNILKKLASSTLSRCGDVGKQNSRTISWRKV